MTTYTVGQLFISTQHHWRARTNQGLCILARIDVLPENVHRYKLIHLMTGNRMSDVDLCVRGGDTVTQHAFRRTWGTQWRPVAPLSDLELALHLTRQEGR